MVGNQYWSVGITVIVDQNTNAFSATLDFYDDGFCNKESTEGTLRVRYWVDELPKALDTLIADAEKLGIAFKYKRLYSDRESQNAVTPEIKELLKAEAARLGWESAYA